MAKIEVQLSGGGHSGLVWSKESVLRLRRDHRILGNLVGADARFPREMTGLPLLLSEQVSALIFLNVFFILFFKTTDKQGQKVVHKNVS